MRKTLLIMWILSLLFTLSSCADHWVSAASTNETPSESEPLPGGPVKLFIATDMHIFPASMHDDSPAYQTFEASGQGKLIGLSDRITDAFVEDALAAKPDAVLITGDMTINGEKLGHETFAAQLGKLTGAGIRVLVIPGNHDINNPHARIIRDDNFYRAEHVTPGEFEEIYRDFGYGDPLYREPESLSYIVRLNKYLYAVMLDTCVYGPNLGSNVSITAGTLDEGTLTWLEESVNEIREGNPEARFVTAMHHNLLGHNNYYNANFIIHSSEKAKELFAKLGLNLVFTGHIHIRNTAESDVEGVKITEIADSALTLYPSEYGVAEIDEEGGRYYTLPVNIPRYAITHGIGTDSPFDLNFYAQTVYKVRTDRITRRGSQMGYNEDELRETIELIKRINAAYLAGSIEVEAEEIKQGNGFEIIEALGMMRGYFDYIFEGYAEISNELLFEW
jgi:3',5'-cyclic AMP phosphodiesterase CpdA